MLRGGPGLAPAASMDGIDKLAKGKDSAGGALEAAEAAAAAAIKGKTKPAKGGGKAAAAMEVRGEPTPPPFFLFKKIKLLCVRAREREK